MTRLSPHFTLEELAVTQVPGFQVVNLVEARNYLDSLTALAQGPLEGARAAVRRPARVNSGFRGWALNARVGGSATSQHCLGQAADLVFHDLADRAGQVAAIQLIVEHGVQFGQLLLELGCIHISLGTKGYVGEYDVATRTKKPIPELVGWLTQRQGAA